MKYRIGPYCWSCNLMLVVCYFCLVALFMYLGFWQLDRADEKRELLKQQAQAQVSSVFTITDAMKYDQDLRYARVSLTGSYDQDQQFLIDNQVLNRRVGYFVMTPFLPDHQQKAVLVNRGWIPANFDRTLLPDLSLQNIKAAITGYINNFPSVGIKLAGAEIPGEGWPSVVQVVDSQILANKLNYPLHKFQVQLDNNMRDGYQRSWKSAMKIMPPEKHRAYAMQWFTFAFILTVLFVVLNVRRGIDESETKT